jgi:hypothetical protein
MSRIGFSVAQGEYKAKSDIGQAKGVAEYRVSCKLPTWLAVKRSPVAVFRPWPGLLPGLLDIGIPRM